MILRDPVHGLMAFEGAAERVLTALLATAEVQRLRRVRQLGLTSLVFPGAEHSRFAHALGAANVMVRLQQRILHCQDDLPPEDRLDEEAACDGLAAAFVHDLGHGPFSHLFEEVLPGSVHHEAWTVRILRDPDTEVHKALEGLSRGMSDRVAKLLSGEYRLGYLGRAVSGTLDVDRSDYLLRDSHMTGVSYGLYDLDWILRGLTFARAPSGDWVLAIEGRKGLPPIEGFFLGRHFMYRQVYHHKATRAAECLIRALFVRLAELVRDGRAPNPTPAALRSAARGEPVTLGDYLALDDAELTSCFAAWQHAEDDILSRLAQDLRARRLPKTVPLPDGAEADGRRREAQQRAEEVVARHGLRTDLHVWTDVTSDTPYAEPDGESPAGLWVRIRRQPIQRLGDISFLLGELRNKRIETPRLIFPAALRPEVEAAIEEVIR